MDKICLIYQPAGIGDIFYSLGIAYHYKKQGYRIIWPVVKEILNLQPYIKDIEFYDWESNFPKKEYYNHDNLKLIQDDDFVFLPIHRSTDIIGGLIMPSKYELNKLDSKIWKENFEWKRDFQKEDELFNNILCLSEDETYILVNQNFVTPPRTIKFPIDIDTEHKIIPMNYIEGYTVFDWAKVIENASGIITIDTCIQYMIDKLNTKAEFYYCYLRNGYGTYNQIKDIFSTPWIFLDKENNTIK
jgi:hypothetical protein